MSHKNAKTNCFTSFVGYFYYNNGFTVSGSATVNGKVSNEKIIVR